MNCLQLITRSLRMLRVTGGVREVPANMTAPALEILQSLILSLPGSTHWTEVEAAAAYTAGENERIRVTVAGSVTITVPSAVSSAHGVLYCCDQVELVCSGGSDRAPRDGARVQICTISGGATTEATYRYCADRGEWLRADSLVLTSTVPVNADLEDGLAALLAVRLADEFGRDLRPVTAAMAADTRMRMRGRYGKRQAVAVDIALLRTSSNPERIDL